MYRIVNLFPIAALCLLLCPAVLIAQGSAPSTATPTPIVTSPPTPTASPTTAPPPSPSPTMTMSDALSQAQNQIPQPPPVYDLTDPAVVYGRLREGVDAWRSSLGVNTDQWGNQITGCYVSAVRPDVVPASLQAFLLEYYAGNPEIGLAFGPDGVAEATARTQHDYDQAVSQLAQQIFDQAAAENAHNQADNGSDDSEDVPPLDEGDQGDGGDGQQGGGDQGGGDQAQQEDATVAAIEKDFGVDLQEGDKQWSTGELAAVRETLSRLPAKWYAPKNLNPPEDENPAPMRIVRNGTISIDGSPDPAVFGCFDPAPPSHIEISDTAWNNWQYDFPNPPFNEDDGHMAEFGGTLVHESTHRYLSTDENGNYISDLADKPIVADWATRFGWQVSGGGWTCTEPERCVTDYAGSENPEEDICESTMMYVFWPNKLRAINQEKYDFIKNVLGIPESSASAPYPP